MFRKGSCKKSPLCGRKGVVAKLPRSTVDCVQIFGVTRDDTNRQTASQYFAVNCEIGSDAKESLTPAWVHAESGNCLVKYQCCVGCKAYLAQFLEKHLRTQIRSSALNRLHQDARQVVRVL